MSTKPENRLGLVVSGSLNQGINVRLDPPCSVEDITVGHLVTIKYVKTVNKEWMHFGTFLDASGEFFDTVHFPRSLQNYPFKGKGVYLILGEVTQEFDFTSLTVDKLAKLPLKPDPREA